MAVGTPTHDKMEGGNWQSQAHQNVAPSRATGSNPGTALCALAHPGHPGCMGWSGCPKCLKCLGCLSHPGCLGCMLCPCLWCARGAREAGSPLHSHSHVLVAFRGVDNVVPVGLSPEDKNSHHSQCGQTCGARDRLCGPCRAAVP